MTYKVRTKTYILAICSALFLPSIALADITMPKNIFYVDQSGKNAKTVFKSTIIQNTSKARAYNVVSKVYKVTKNNGQQSETRVATNEVSVFPPFFTLEPNTVQKIRIIARTNLIDDDTESAYRVQFIPQVSVDDTQMLEIVTTMGALVFVKPTQVIGDLAWSRNDKAIVLKNKSNTNIVLRNSKTCRKSFSCIANNVRLWPGNTLKINTPKSLDGRTVNLEKSTYGISENVRISN